MPNDLRPEKYMKPIRNQHDQLQSLSNMQQTQISVPDSSISHITQNNNASSTNNYASSFSEDNSTTTRKRYVMASQTDTPETTRDARNARKMYMSAKRLKVSQSNGDEHDEVLTTETIPGIKGYKDDGDATYICCNCKARLWYGERIRKQRLSNNPIFTLCCMQGKVTLPVLDSPPDLLRYLLTSDDDTAIHCRENIRAFNMMFSFTSLGGKINYSINRGRVPPIFQLHGENYHLMGSLKPEPSNTAKFGQLYIHDTENEITNRLHAYSEKNSSENSCKLRPDLVEALMKMLDEFNPLCQAWRMAKDRFDLGKEEKVYLRLIAGRGKDGRTHNTPTCSEIAALIVGDLDMNMDKRDIVIEDQCGQLKRISELHASYLPLQYPLLFPYGQDGYRLGILTRDSEFTEKKRKTITLREWFAYRIQDRVDEFPILLYSRRLYQQFLVDAFTMIESNRLQYLKQNQQTLRSANYTTLRTTEENGPTDDSSKQGKQIYLPSSFIGGKRYMMQNYLDAMAISKYFGFPDLFITFTCNPKWPEITRYLNKHSLKSEDRPDITCRIFKIKLDAMIQDLTKNDLLGKVVSGLYTVEFQKRGLPHAHILLFMHQECKLPNEDDIDKIICAEIPCEKENPELHEVVREMMIHGPCGSVNPNSPCMVDGVCSKFFPKDFTETTKLDEDGYPVYRRRDGGRYVEKGGIRCDNRYVVPYNKELLLRYKAHINVEWCNQSRSIKYLFKYINKGQDKVTATISRKNNAREQEKEEKDEIQDYYECRYVSACEATWRILAFPIHHRTTAVQKLIFHLENQQLIIFNEEENVDDILNRESVHQSMFLSWMECNKRYPVAKELTYVEFPKYFVWTPKTKQWTPRKKGFSIGRLSQIPTSLGELFFLRILINIKKGPTSYEEIRTVDGVVYPTFKEACYSLGLMDDDNEYIEGIKEASYWGTSSYMRRLFAIMLLSESISVPRDVWDKTWEILSEDILFKRRKILHAPGLSLDEEQIKNYALMEIDKILRSNGSSLSKFPNMPIPPESHTDDTLNQLIVDELRYDREKLASDFRRMKNQLTDEQTIVYNNIMDAVVNDKGGVFFVYGFGGTGKTFLWEILSATIRSKGDIVLNCASSGIAALLLEGGRTAHSRFGIPLKPDEFTTCSMVPNSDIAELISLSKLIVWDEAPMMSKYCFESLDRSLNDIIGKRDHHRPFGGKVVVFGGDFRQVLPVINGGTRQDIVLASLTSSYLWEHCKILKLTKNMRLLANQGKHDAEEIKQFSEWILNIGDGKINEPNTGEVEIDIPDDYLIPDSSDPVDAIVRAVYGDSLGHSDDPIFFQQRAILCPTNEDVDVINNYMLSKLPGEERVYLSSDSICPSDTNFNGSVVYSQEYLNSIKVSGLPHHMLRLKIGVPVMLLRNIDSKNGFCNGTRLQITQMADHIIEAIVITGNQNMIGKKVFFPRMLISPSDTKYPFKFRRRQFPLSMAFAMTINKSQGQTLKQVGLYLPRPVFSHGQLYVALSRVSSKQGLKILITDKHGKAQKKTVNVVFKEIYRNLR